MKHVSDKMLRRLICEAEFLGRFLFSSGTLMFLRTERIITENFSNAIPTKSAFYFSLASDSWSSE